MTFTLSERRLRPAMHRWPAGTVLHRVHARQHPGVTFNSGAHRQPTRFAPFTDDQNVPVPYLYASGSFECALYETLFHDIPASEDIRVAPDLTAALAYTEMVFDGDLELIELTSRALPRLNLSRAEVIDSTALAYPQTIALARRLWAETASQGLYWISRQDDRAPCVLIFGDRAPPPRCVQTHGVIADSIELMGAVIRAASAANIVLLPATND